MKAANSGWGISPTRFSYHQPNSVRSSGGRARRSSFPPTRMTDWAWISGRQALRLWHWPNRGTGYSERSFRTFGPMPVTVMNRTLTSFHSSILSTTILKVDGTSHRPRLSQPTGRRTVTIAGPFPSGAGSAVWLNSAINRWI